MNGGQRNGTNAQIWESKTTGIMMATVPHVTSGLGLRKFQADGFLLTRVYICVLTIFVIDIALTLAKYFGDVKNIYCRFMVFFSPIVIRCVSL